MTGASGGAVPQPSANGSSVNGRLHPADLDALADLVAERLAEQLAVSRPLPPVVTADELAGYLGVSRDVIYANADRLGVIRLGEQGPGRRPALRFPLDAEAVEAWRSRPVSENPQPSDPSTDAGSAPKRAGRMAKRVDLLPIHDGREAA